MQRRSGVHLGTAQSDTERILAFPAIAIKHKDIWLTILIGGAPSWAPIIANSDEKETMMDKKQRVHLIVLLPAFFLAFLFGSVSSAKENKSTSPNAAGPVAVAIDPTYEFEPVVEGKKVSHTYHVANKGNAPLSILNVKTGCGCTMANYSKNIAAGETGEITIEGNTANYGGRTFSRKIIVYTDDPKNPQLTLDLSVKVVRAVTLVPNRVRLFGESEKKIAQSVRIIPEKNYPFKIKEVKLFDGKNILYDLEETQSSGKLEYLLNIQNTCKKTIRYFDKITLITDNKAIPEIEIKVFGNISEKMTTGKM